MSKQIQSIIANNLFWFIASLILAIMVWFVATIEANPIDQRVFTRPISVLVDETMIISSRSSDTARVFVTAQESVLNILQPDDITVSVDLRGRIAGTYTVSLRVDISRPANSDTQPTQITVTIEPRISQQVPVDILVVPPPINYETGIPERDIFQAVVSGSSASVNRVSRVVGEFDLANQQSAQVVERTVTLRAEDADGNPVTEVSIDPMSLAISISVTQRENIRTFAVRPNIDFSTLPNNFQFNDWNYEPNSIIIDGPPEVLDSLGETINTLPISLENRTGNFTVEVGLDLPDDASLIIVSESSTIVVDIFMSEEESTLPVESVPIRVIGESPNSGLTVTVSPLSISAVLTGPLSIIESLDVEDIQAVVDVNGLDAGSHTLVPRIEIEQGQISLEAFDINLIPAQVSVTIASTQPEATESSESSPDLESTAEADD